jgi:recombination protein RecT
MTAPTNPVAKAAPTKLGTLRALIEGEGMKKELARALPKVIGVERFTRTLITTLQKMPELAECDQGTVLAGIVTAAQLGLEIDATMGRAYLLPYNDRQKGKIAQLIIGYRGFVELAYRSGQIASFQAEVVYANDEFEYELGLNPRLKHLPSTSDDRGELRYAYAVVKLTSGGSVFRVLGPADIKKARASSRAASSSYSPWNTHPDEMWRKTAIRAIAKMLPLSPELRDAVRQDDDDDTNMGKAFGRATEVPAAVQPDPAPGEPPAEGQPPVREAEVVDPPKDSKPLVSRQQYNVLFAKLSASGADDKTLDSLRLPPNATQEQVADFAGRIADMIGEPR